MVLRSLIRIFPDMPSGLEALVVPIESNRLNTYSLVQRISSDITAEGSAEKLCREASVSGGTAGLKL